MVVGLLLWFVLTNNERVTIAFPFGLGHYQSTTGLVILLSALVGSILTALGMTIFLGDPEGPPGARRRPRTALPARSATTTCRPPTTRRRRATA